MEASSLLFCQICGAANSPLAALCFACGQPPLASLETGQPAHEPLLKQRYRKIRQLGQGGMGAVYQAEDTALGNRIVAIKEVVLRELQQEEEDEAVRSFKHEALLLASLTHPHLPRIHEHFEQAGRWYLVMDFIEGQTLEDYLEKTPSRTLPLKEVIELGLQLCTVLDYLHTRQPAIIFRDLKPSNIMRTPGGHLYLIDFGIARHFTPGQAKDTIPLGSPGYAAPEQYGRSQTTPRTDLYSLGALLHTMLTGIDPSITPFIFAPLETGPAELQQLLTQLLSIHMDKRPATAATLKAELQRLISLEQIPPPKRPSPSIARSPAPRQYSVKAAAHQWQQIIGTNSMYPTYTPEHFTNNNAVIASSPTSGPFTLSTDFTTVHAGYVSAVALSADGQTLVGAYYDRKINVWDLPSGRWRWTQRGDTCVVWCVAISARQDLVLSASGELIIWDLSTGARMKCLKNHDIYAFSSVALSADGKTLVGGNYNHTLQVWHLPGGKQVGTLRDHTAPVNSVAISPDGQTLISGSSDYTIKLWNLFNGQLIRTLIGHTAPVNSVAISPDGRTIVSGSGDHTIKLWNLSEGQELATLSDHTGPVNSIAISGNGQILISGSDDHTLQVWDLLHGQQIQTLRGHTDIVSSVATSADGKVVVSSSRDNTIKVWRALF